MCNASETQLSEAWSSLLALIREGSSLSPPAQFLLAAILHELMIKCCPLEEKKKDQKDLQDVTAKVGLLEIYKRNEFLIFPNCNRKKFSS